MEGMILVLILLFLQQTVQFSGVSAVGYYKNVGTGFRIRNVFIDGQKQMVYISMFDIDGQQKVKSYELKNGVLTQFDTFYSKFITNHVTLYYGRNFLIGIGFQSPVFNYYKIDGSFISAYSINQTVTDIIEAKRHAIVIYLTKQGNLYWVDEADFPAVSYKNLLIGNLSGTIKAVLSPSEDLLAIGVSGESAVYLIDLGSLKLMHKFELFKFDTRAIIWDENSTKIYVAPVDSGMIYQLSAVDFNMNNFIYQTESLVRVSSIEYYWQFGEIVVFGYSINSTNNVTLYGFNIATKKVVRNQSYLYTNMSVQGKMSYGAIGRYYAEWSANEVYFRRVSYECGAGCYYNEVEGTCMICPSVASDCTALGCTQCAATNSGSTTTTTTTNTNTTNTANTTNPITNATSSANNTSNTNNSTTANTTNKNTTNNTSNQTNTLKSDNRTSQNSNQSLTSNDTALDPNSTLTDYNQTDIYLQTEQDSVFKTFNIILNSTLKSEPVNFLNTIPAARTILKPVFTFFGNLDDLWPYIYHPRNYQFVITQTFQSITHLERQKWKAIPYHQLWPLIGINTTQIEYIATFKKAYSPQKFIQIESTSSEYLIATADFYFSNLFIIIALFFTLKFMFNLLKKFRISIFFKKYSLYATLIVMTLDGNLQICPYLTFFEFKWLFNVNSTHKIITIWVILNFFLIFLFSTGSYFILRYLYKRLSKFFHDNISVSNIGSFYLIAQIGVRNIILGFVHSIGFSTYFFKILVLLSIEISFFVMELIMVRKRKIFESKLNVWIHLIGTFIRMMVIGIFLFQQEVENEQITSTSKIFAILIINYMGLGVINVLTEVIRTFFEVIDVFKPQQKETNSQKQKEVQKVNFKIRMSGKLNGSNFTSVTQSPKKMVKFSEPIKQLCLKQQNKISNKNERSDQKCQNIVTSKQELNIKSQKVEKTIKLPKTYKNYKKLRLRKTLDPKILVGSFLNEIKGRRSQQQQMIEKDMVKFYLIK